MADKATLPVLPLAGHRHILLAVSGGSDSTALLHLAAWQRQTLANPPQITAVTVDHRLRSGSTAEARAVETMCAALGIRHMILAWEGDKPTSGIQDAARNARRSLIAAAAVRIGADIVFTGHTYDDQLETVAMRQKRGTGPGLAGIAPVSFVFDDAGAGEVVQFRRPMLGASRAVLQGLLRLSGISWVDDPSNDNDAFERVAVRRELAQSDRSRHAELAHACRQAASGRITASRSAARLVEDFVFATAPGLIRIDHAIASVTETECAAVLRILMAFSAGTPFPAEIAHAVRLQNSWRQALANSKVSPVRIGLGGALADIRRDGLYLLQEQRRNIPNPASFAGRYRLTGIEPASSPPPPNADPVSAPASLIRKAAVAEPIFDCPSAGATSCDEAYRNGRRLRLLLNPWPDLVPSFDLPAYNSLAAVIGAPPIDSPLL